tara:strand:+ start:268 stop:708 length:441 start_codon:yes stop_codon:yes gene_type:complete
MLLISHRGNIFGINKEKENSPKQIEYVIKQGFDVEIDVWSYDFRWFLGHDYPEYEVNFNFIYDNSKNLWCHAKNLEALHSMCNSGIRCFWHENDDFTLTSDNKIWTYPLKNVTENSIIVCRNVFETKRYYRQKIHGICSDFVGLVI